MATPQAWDERFLRGDHADADPDTSLTRSRKYWALLPGVKLNPEGRVAGSARPRALDVAAGAGRNATALAEAGFAVTAIDFSRSGLDRAAALAAERGVSIDCRVEDLESDSVDLGEEVYDLAAVFFFLHRPLFPLLRRCLVPGGLIVYKTYSIDQARCPGRPSRPAYMLGHNELLEAFAGFRVLRYEEEWEGKGTASLIAQKP